MNRKAKLYLNLFYISIILVTDILYLIYIMINMNFI